MMTVEAQLHSIPLLASLDPRELSELATACRERNISRGGFIVCEDDPGPNLMFLTEGEAKVTLLSEDGKEVVLALLQAGDFFGELALLTGEDRSANVVAVSDCSVLVLSKRDFERHLLRCSGLSLALLRELATRLRAATTKIGELALYDVHERVRKTLLALSRPTGRKNAHGEEIRIIEKRPTHQELAAMVGATREGVTRALKTLEECLVIKSDGKKVEITGDNE